METLNKRIKNIFEKCEIFQKLKLLPRTGWLLSGIANPESVADHTFLTTLLVYFMACEIKHYNNENCNKNLFDVDIYRAVTMANIHELGEAMIGDITPYMSKYIKNKEAIEKEAVSNVLIGDGFEKNAVTLFNDFIDMDSNEAILVRAADKIEMMIQYKIYRKNNFQNLAGFIKGKPDMSFFSFHPLVCEMAEIIYSDIED